MTASPSALPAGLESYKRTAVFTGSSVPAGLLNDHRTKAGVWGLIHVERGKLLYRITDPRRPACEHTLSAGEAPGVVEPVIAHHVQPIGETAFWVEFFR